MAHYPHVETSAASFTAALPVDCGVMRCYAVYMSSSTSADNTKLGKSKGEKPMDM